MSIPDRPRGSNGSSTRNRNETLYTLFFWIDFDYELELTTLSAHEGYMEMVLAAEINTGKMLAIPPAPRLGMSF